MAGYFRFVLRRIALRLNDHGVRSTHAASQAAERLGAEMLGKRARVEASGLSYLAAPSC